MVFLGDTVIQVCVSNMCVSLAVLNLIFYRYGKEEI